jgi:hypothetical protein
MIRSRSYPLPAAEKQDHAAVFVQSFVAQSGRVVIGMACFSQKEDY